MINTTRAIILFSGGLDSLLAAKILEQQNIDIICLHFYSPFFGSPQKVELWRKIYGLNIIPINTGPQMASLLLAGPEHGFGSHLNPCMDCKILQLSTAKKFMQQMGASFLATGEVVGQRPMSQRRDALNRIMKKADVSGFVLRPLSAKLLSPTLAESSGLVNRERLYAISGRGRNPQLQLAAEFGIEQIPSPAGGCRLTEKENSRRYWQVLQKYSHEYMEEEELAEEFAFADLGRQFWRNQNSSYYWLSIGRTSEDNRKLLNAARQNDLCLRLADMAGPIAVARNGRIWPASLIREAASLTAGHCQKAKEKGTEIKIRVYNKMDSSLISVKPQSPVTGWSLPSWEEVREGISCMNKKMQKKDNE